MQTCAADRETEALDIQFQEGFETSFHPLAFPGRAPLGREETLFPEYSGILPKFARQCFSVSRAYRISPPFKFARTAIKPSLYQIVRAFSIMSCIILWTPLGDVDLTVIVNGVASNTAKLAIN
jgi:hypothetical protein